MRALGYARVSTDRQSERGISIDVQSSRIRAMAEIQGAELLDVIVEGESAKTLNRPGVERLLQLVDSSMVDMVIVAKLDRITRSVKDLAELLERFSRRGVALVSVAESLDTATASGRLVMNLLMSVAQWEREVIGERTRQALQFKKSIGERIGGIPFGYQLSSDGKRLESKPSEQAIIEYATSLRAAGCTLRAIALEMNQRGMTTRCGGQWHHVYVAGLVKSQRGKLAA